MTSKTSKESLNKIQHHINGTELSGKELLECYETIDKDLERKEALEKMLCETYEHNKDLRKENRIKDGMIKHFETEYKKLEKAIEILNRYIDIKEGRYFLKGKYYYILRLDYYENLTKEEYDLLKEVLECQIK